MSRPRTPGRYAYAAINGRKVSEHILAAERALGKRLPKLAEVHHVNGEKDDNRNANLVICEDHAYHALLHVRTRVLAAGGNPNTDRICTKCRLVKPSSEFHSNRTRPLRACKVCVSNYGRTYRSTHYRDRRKRVAV